MIFHKISADVVPDYSDFLLSLHVNQSYQTINGDKFLHMSCRTGYFGYSYFPHTMKEENNLGPAIRKSVSYEVFKNLLMKFMRPSPNSLLTFSQ